MKEFGWPRLINCLQNNQSCPEMENLAIIIAKNFMFDNVAQGIQEIDQFKSIVDLISEKLGSKDA